MLCAQIEESILQTARVKLDAEAMVISAGMFNDKFEESQSHDMLTQMIRKQAYASICLNTYYIYTSKSVRLRRLRDKFAGDGRTKSREVIIMLMDISPISTQIQIFRHYCNFPPTKNTLRYIIAHSFYFDSIINAIFI